MLVQYLQGNFNDAKAFILQHHEDDSSEAKGTSI